MYGGDTVDPTMLRETFTGNTLPLKGEAFVSHGENIVIRFVSDALVTHTGFKFKCHATPGKNIYLLRPR